jgi:hypothetical protein
MAKGCFWLSWRFSARPQLVRCFERPVSRWNTCSSSQNGCVSLHSVLCPTLLTGSPLFPLLSCPCCCLERAWKVMASAHLIDFGAAQAIVRAIPGHPKTQLRRQSACRMTAVVDYSFEFADTLARVVASIRVLTDVSSKRVPSASVDVRNRFVKPGCFQSSIVSWYFGPTAQSHSTPQLPRACQDISLPATLC